MYSSILLQKYSALSTQAPSMLLQYLTQLCPIINTNLSDGNYLIGLKNKNFSSFNNTNENLRINNNKRPD